MILAVDSSALALLVNPAANPPDDPATGKPVEHARERVEYFIASLTASDTMIIPTPVLAEALVRAEDGGPGLLEALGGMARVKVRPFGELAAIETAVMTREAIQAGDKRGGSEAAWQKVKVDRQVVAVARVERATRIYADDHNLVAFAKRLGMDAFSTWDLQVPPVVDNLFTVAGVPMDAAEQEDVAADQETDGDVAVPGVSAPEAGDDEAPPASILPEAAEPAASSDVVEPTETSGERTDVAADAEEGQEDPK